MLKKLFIVLILIMTLSGCSKKEEAIPALVEPVGAEIDTAVATRGDIYSLVTYDAKIYPEIHEVSFSVDGRLKDIYVYLGQEVKEGDLLIGLDDESMLETLARLEEDLEETYQKDEYELSQLELDIQLTQLNLEQKKANNATEMELSQLESDLEKLELRRQQSIETQNFNNEKLVNKIEEMKQELEKYKITAPRSGKIAYINYVSMGGYVNAESTMVIIADDTKLHVQSQYINPNVINKAGRVFAIVGDKEYDIEYIPLSTDEAIKMKNGTTGIESRYKIDPDPEVKSGDYASVCLQNELKSNVITIPIKALFKEAGGNFVYRLKDGALERIDVEVGLISDIQVEIISGLEEGDVVYVQG